MSDLVALIQSEIERYLRARVTEKYGLVTSYDEEAHTAKVMIQPDKFETGWLRISEAHIGDGWGMVSGFQIGDQVKVSVVGGDINSGTITGRVHSDQDKPPTAKSGEIVLQHTSGARIKFSEDNRLTLSGAGGGTVVLQPDGSVVSTDSGGAVVRQAGGNVYLGSANATQKVMLESGPSTKIYGV